MTQAASGFQEEPQFTESKVIAIRSQFKRAMTAQTEVTPPSEQIKRAVAEVVRSDEAQALMKAGASKIILDGLRQEVTLVILGLRERAVGEAAKIITAGAGQALDVIEDARDYLKTRVPHFRERIEERADTLEATVIDTWELMIDRLINENRK